MTLKKQLSKKTYLVGSGKGGVGKSTVAVNMSIALAAKGKRVGLLDADLYGPSIPVMLGLRRLSPRKTKNNNGQERLLPVEKFGIQVISAGFFIEESRAVVWRGPMLHGLLEKLINDVEWRELDILIIDLPPGTGDVGLSLAQLLSIDGAFVVTTPQEVAMVDAVKSINAFHQLDIPLIGIIENMAGFTVETTGETHHIFGQGKAQELARRFQTDLLYSIPLITKIREGGDEGVPASVHAGAGQTHFFRLAEAVLDHEHAVSTNPFH